jgi:thiosulfate reductase/polysulfide reductase chain A
MGQSRREFIKIGGAAVAAAAAGTGLATKWWGLDPDVVHDPGTDGDKVVPTFCELCFWKCGVLAHVRNGRVTKIQGNPEHPLSNGRLCPRGTGGMGLLYDPDRLKKPLLRRKGRRGEQAFEEVSWEAALDFTAEKLELIRKAHGPEAVALFSHGYGGSFFKTLMAAYGSASIAAPSYAQCRGAREVGFQLTFGSSLGSPENLDLANSRCITLIGSHLGENMHNTQVQDFAAAIAKGATVIAVDPRFSTAAGKAKYWLPIKPGTDIALLLAWMHVIVNEGLYDREYVDTHTTGLAELKAHLVDKTPEWAFTETTIRPEVIVETARVIAGARPASLIHPGRHTSWYGDDTQRSRAVAILNALVGSWGRRGGFFVPASMGAPKIALPAPATKPRPAPDTPKGVSFPFADETLAHGLRDASIPGTAAYDVKGWIVYGTNLIQALPEPAKTVKAIQALDLLVAVDVLPAEIVGWADVVLPECTYLERWDDVGGTPWREPFLAVRQPVVAPMHESKPGWWIAKQLATRLGHGDFFPYDDAGKMVEGRLAKGGFDVDAVKAKGLVRGKAVPVTTEDGLALAFATPSKKIEIFSKQMEAVGLPPLPVYTSPEEPAPGSFRLLYGRSPVHTFGRTTNNRFLGEVAKDNEVWLNAKIAKERGLVNGQSVVLVNQDGVKSPPARLKATERMRPDCVYVVHGFGHTEPGLRFAKGRGIDDNALMSRAKVDPAMGGTGMNVNFVSLEKA